MNEKEVREIVKSVLNSQLKDIPTKEQVKSISKDEAKKVADENLTNKDVKEIVKNTLLSYHRWMWDKKGIWINQI